MVLSPPLHICGCCLCLSLHLFNLFTSQSLRLHLSMLEDCNKQHCSPLGSPPSSPPPSSSRLLHPLLHSIPFLSFLGVTAGLCLPNHVHRTGLGLNMGLVILPIDRERERRQAHMSSFVVPRCRGHASRNKQNQASVSCSRGFRVFPRFHCQRRL